MSRDLHARYTGDDPFYEVWYGKVNIGPGRAFWFRYTLLDGTVREAASWAILFDRNDIMGDRRVFPLEDLSLPGEGTTIFFVDDQQLKADGARGRCGDLRWNLQWTSRRRGFRYIPPWIEDLGLSPGNYDSCLPDLNVEGTVGTGTETYELNGVPGMVGHIYGRRMSGRAWGWIHCNDFVDRSDAVFEALALQLGEGTIGRWVSPVSWYVLYIGERRRVFRPPLTLWRADNTVGSEGWTFRVRGSGDRLEGRVRRPDRTALVEYTDTDGSKRWCENSKLASLELTYQPVDGDPVQLRADGTSAFEWVSRNPPDRDPLVT